MTGQLGERGLFHLLVFTALISGAMVMVVEVLGSKVIGPVFGVSLFVWTSLIAVTLVALAVGYALGGMLSDRHPSPDALYGLLAAAGLLVLLVPFAKSPVLRACQPLGLRLGAFSSAAALFGPPLILLGAVSPYVVKLATREIDRIGRTVGVFYSVSTVGSFAGTVLAGFYLLAYFSVGRIFQMVGAVLIALAVVYFVFFRRRWLLAGLLVFPALLAHDRPLRSVTTENGTRVDEIHAEEGYYGHLTVVDYHYRSKRYRELLIDGQVQGAIDTENGLSIFPYTYFLDLIPHRMNPHGRDCLVIGLGAGIVPRWYERNGVTVDVVDINADLVEVAREYFDFEPSGEVIVADARYYLRTTRKTYDYVILDVFNGDTTPEHVLSVESFHLVKQRLTPGGILALNVMGSLRRDVFITASVAMTLGEVFRTVEIYPVFPEDLEAQAGSIVLIAHDGTARPFDAGAFVDHSVHSLARRKMGTRPGRRFRFPSDTPAIVLTDDYNPAGYFDLWLKEQARSGILRDIYLELLL